MNAMPHDEPMLGAAPGALERADEFSPGAAEWPNELSRRKFLRLTAGTLALGGATCTKQPPEFIVPHVRQPDASGASRYFATAAEFGGEAYGILVRSDSGRPTKIEGNPDHPSTLGRSSVHLQAALLTLYDPARSAVVTRVGRPATWQDLLAGLLEQQKMWEADGGAGLRILTRRVGSPTLLELLQEVKLKYPACVWHEHDAAFATPALERRIHLKRARVVLCLDGDLFGPGAMRCRETAEFAAARNTRALRLYVVESMPSLTGAMADHRLALAPSRLAEFARRLRVEIETPMPGAEPWLAAVARDLKMNGGASLVVAGEHQPEEVHRLCLEMNHLLGSTGTTIVYPPKRPEGAPLGDLIEAMRGKRVKSLIILGGNPVYDAPADLDFASAMAEVPFTLHQGLYRDETARACTWHVPESHFLECWGDARAEDGRACLQQPLIEPLNPSRSGWEMLAALAGHAVSEGYDIIRQSWLRRHGEDGFERYWNRCLHDGIEPALPAEVPEHPSLTNNASTRQEAIESGLELIIRPDPDVLDGRQAENAWLQELPKPFTKLTWENAIHMSPGTARELKIEHGERVELHYRGRMLDGPVWILPGHADGCVTIHLGYGRRHGSAIARGLGFNAFALRMSDAPWGGIGLTIRKTGRSHVFSTTQDHQRMEGREPVRQAEFGKPLPTLAEEAPAPEETLYPPVHYDRPAWGMVINLTSCIGCSACTIACQAENNIPVVGREQVLRGREMHWIRVDVYHSGSEEKVEHVHQPVPCMHCENAPCEMVCPVAATVHDHEGLNLMVYNRCIGTRYCSNNCPYKVRRFNFLAYTGNTPERIALMRNPEVSVRMRGVMEKCTYCVQRISTARIAASKETRPIRDGEVIPACAQACPAEAIVFGDLLDPTSRVSALRKSPYHYALLAELNTRPRTTYLARVRNRNPEAAET